MKKKFLFALTASTITAAAAVALMPHAGVMSFAEGCEHEGNHYEAVAATCESAGNKEFWACCVCHEQFVTAPGKGTWEDKGAYAGPALASTHAAYLAPLAHTPGDWNVYDRGTKVGLNASCSECGAPVYDEDVETADKPVVSTAEWDVLTTTPSGALYDWTYDEEAGTYTANNKKIGSSVALLQLNVTKAGTIAFDFSIICEVSYDYLTVYKNSSITSWTYSSASYSGNGKVMSTYGQGANTGYAGSYTIDVAAGDKISFAKRNDGSGWGKKNGADYDECVLTIKGSFTYGMARYETNGGSAVNPSITINGKLAHDAPTPTKDGYIFDGWYKTSTYSGDPVTKDTYIGDNVTLYAKWWDENDSHALMGSYKGFGFKSNSTTFTNTILSNYSIEIDYKGGLIWVSSNSTDAFNGTFGDVDADGKSSIDSREVLTFENGNVIVVRKTAANSSNYYWVFVKDSTQTYTSGTISGVSWGTYSAGYRTVMEFPLADGSKKVAYIDNVNNVFKYGVQVTSLKDDVALKDVATSTNVGFSIYNSDATLYKNFGYNGSTMVETTDNYFGKYENSVAGDECTSILVSGAGKFSFWDGTKYNNSNDYKERKTNVIYYGSSETAYEYTLNTETKKFTRSIPTVTITYNLNGHTAELQVGSKYELVGLTQRVAKAFDSNSGAWLYEESLATVKNNVATDGNYSFEGWYKDSACSQPVTRFHPTEDITFYAKWAETFLVTCVLNNGQEDTIVTVKEGQTPTLTEPTRDGYMFGGWFTDPECDNPYVPGAISGNITVYAKWIKKPDWAGTYQGAEIWGTYQNRTATVGVYYDFKFFDDGKIKRGSNYGTTYGQYSAAEGIGADGALPIKNSSGTAGYKMQFAKYNNERYVFTTAYSSNPSADSVPDDFAMEIQVFEGESVTAMRWTTLMTGKYFLIEATLKKADNSNEIINLIVDAYTNKVYAGVTIETVRGGVTANTFESVYTSSYADLLTFRLNGTAVLILGKNNGSLVLGDEYAGTYTGAFNGSSDVQIVLDGFGNCTVGDVSGTYTVNEGVFTITLATGTYKISLSGSSFTQILDGYEGTYTGANGVLVVSGYGTCTLDGVGGTYVISGGKLKVTVAGATSFYSVDKAAGTYVVAEASEFSGLEFLGTEDCNSYQYAFFIHFNEGAAIEGYCAWNGRKTDAQVDNEYNAARFTGEYDAENCRLTITFTAAKAASDLVGKYLMFDVDLERGYMITAGTNITRNSFIIDGGYYVFAD